MNTSQHTLIKGIAASVLLALSASASAGSILFVSDSGTDANIAGVLTGDGHSVTVRSGNFAGGINNDLLLGDLGTFDAVFWSATGSGFGDTHSAGQFTDLNAYVNAGGRVFVTGYDTVASPTDANLIAFLGGSGSLDFGGSNDPGPVTGANSLSIGVIDIQGVSPTGGYTDWDTLTGLLAGTTCVAVRPGVAGGCAWSLRSVGAGEIAYVSNGAFLGSASDPHPSWTDTSAGGAGAWNAAVRNFAFNASSVAEPGALALLVGGVLAVGGRRRRSR